MRGLANLIAVLVVLGALTPVTAAAKVPVCIRVGGNGLTGDGAAGLLALIGDEVRRHPSHSPVEADCAVTLNVDVLNVPVGAGTRRYATAYLDGQLPHRVEIGQEATFDANLRELVGKALGSDPLVVLEDDDALAELVGSRLQLLDGEMSYGIEAGQATLFLGSHAAFAPALGFRVRRGLGPFHVGARLRAAFLPVEPAVDGTPVPTVSVVLEPEFAWFVTPDATTSFYLAGALGISVLRYDGKPGGDDAALVDWGVHCTARIGVEFLRAADFRLDLFAAAVLPWFVTDSETSTLVDDWTPTVEVGFGVAF